MSGHSKWATIKRQKGAADIKRGAAFTKLSNAITLAVKQGGGIADPDQNFRLRLAIDMAKTNNMPKETIERAIQRAVGKDAANFEELIYEGFAPGGVAVVVETATDNNNRTSGAVKGLFNKAGASFGQPGSVSYLFQTLGMITVKKEGKSTDDIFNASVESGAVDIEEVDSNTVSIYTTPDSLNRIRQELERSGFNVESSEFVRKPITKVPLDMDQTQKVINFLSSLEELEDVQKVYSNIQI